MLLISDGKFHEQHGKFAMSNVCTICGKGPSSGNMIARRGRAKYLGGVGIKQTGVSKRKFKPNLQRIWAVVDGRTKRINVCAKCIKTGRVQKPAR